MKMETKESILGLSVEDMTSRFEVQGLSQYRSKQVYDWLYRKGVTSFQEMTTLGKLVRKDLAEYFTLDGSDVKVLESIDGTRKYQFKLHDGNLIESVWIPEENRTTLCISSQVGCPLKCAFCVTGALGYQRNLTAAEIVAQVRHVKSVEGRPLSNVVFMGMGEPLLNPDGVRKAIEIINSDHGLQIGRRKITVSTAGLVPQIRPFLAKCDINLAISLTGFSDEERDHWMPINKKHSLDELMKCLRSIPLARGRGFMFEITIIRDQNDNLVSAKKLVDLVRGIPCRINLIPYNENSYFPELKCPDEENLGEMRRYIVSQGIFTIIRKNRGGDIMAACGQLAGTSLDEERKTEE